MVRHFIAWLIDTILPRHVDAERGRRIHLASLTEKISPQTLPGKPWLTALLSYHDGEVRAAIKALKYYGETGVAKIFGELIADYLGEVVAEGKALHGWREVVLCPVPSSPRRLRERGYNQAEKIARHAAELLEITYDPKLLVREERVSQVHVDRSKRRENIKGAFTTTTQVHGISVIVVDDVVESGATLADARRALVAQGARHVIAIAVAH